MESLDLFIYLFIYLFLAVLGLCCCTKFSVVAESGGYTLVAVGGLLIVVCGAFSCCRTGVLGCAAPSL